MELEKAKPIGLADNAYWPDDLLNLESASFKSTLLAGTTMVASAKACPEVLDKLTNLLPD